MSSLSFSLSDYQAGLASGRYLPPDALCPYYEVDPVLYRKHGTTEKRRKHFHRAIEEVRIRTGRDYFARTYPLQARTLDYSARCFPAYRFILPEVLTEDWLAIVDWGKFQRDHVLHQPLCGYVVLSLLDEHAPKGPLRLPRKDTILEACVNHILKWEETKYIRDFLVSSGMSEKDPILNGRGPIAKAFWRVFFREAAYVAALFHDLGYPWQYAERVHGNLDGMSAPALKQNRSAREVVELFGSRLMYCALHGYQFPEPTCPSTWTERLVQLSDKALMTTHGFPGALGFLYLNDCVRRHPCRRISPIHLLCIEWAATAIMMHDMSKIYWGDGIKAGRIPDNPFLRVSFGVDPLSALITLTDVIQDFDRPFGVFGKTLGGSTVSLDYESSCLGTELDLDASGRLTITYRMRSVEARAQKRACLTGELREYFDARYGYLDMSSLGITEVRMFAS